MIKGVNGGKDQKGQQTRERIYRRTVLRHKQGITESSNRIVLPDNECYRFPFRNHGVQSDRVECNHVRVAIFFLPRSCTSHCPQT